VPGRALGEVLTAAPFRLVSLDGGGSWNRDPQGSDGDVLAAPERESEFRPAVEIATSSRG
jgi:hypothetical protein